VKHGKASLERLARIRKVKVAATVGVVVALWGSVQAIELGVLVEQKRRNIEVAIKSFQKECGRQVGTQACKNQRDALIESLKGFVTDAQTELEMVTADEKRDNPDIDKQTTSVRWRAERRARTLANIQWAQEQMKTLEAGKASTR
jgi:hypothetical protein